MSWKDSSIVVIQEHLITDKHGNPAIVSYWRGEDGSIHVRGVRSYCDDKEK